METSEAPTISFIVVETEEFEPSKGIFRRRPDELVVEAIPVETLKVNLDRAINSLSEVLSSASHMAGNLRLREAHVGVEISAKGGVSFVGTAEIAAKGGITLVFGE